MICPYDPDVECLYMRSYDDIDYFICEYCEVI